MELVLVKRLCSAASQLLIGAGHPYLPILTMMATKTYLSQVVLESGR